MANFGLGEMEGYGNASFGSNVNMMQQPGARIGTPTMPGRGMEAPGGASFGSNVNMGGTGGLNVGGKFYTQQQIDEFYRNGGDDVAFAKREGIADPWKMRDVVLQARQMGGAPSGDAALQQNYQRYQQANQNGTDFNTWKNGLSPHVRDSIMSGSYTGDYGAPQFDAQMSGGYSVNGDGYGGGGGGGGGSNPYLAEQAQGIISQMHDNWTRNQLPSIRSGAMAAGGFGSSRQGVVEANGLNDLNRSLGQNLANLYGSAWDSSQNRALQQQSINNSYNLGMANNNLGFANLDANINNSNFQNNLASANFGLGAYNTMMGQTQAGINAGTNIQNTPLEYQKYFTNSANGIGRGYGSSTSSSTAQGDPFTSMVGGGMLGNSIYKNWK